MWVLCVLLRHMLKAGQLVKLRGLEGRPALNGCHGIVLATNAEEAAELQLKGRIKVSTALADEVLSVRLANVEQVQTTEHTIFSTRDFAVVLQPGRGYTWRALRRIASGKVLWREEPLVVHRMADHLVDPIMQALQDQLEPYMRQESYPPEAMRLFDQSAERIAERFYGQLSANQQKRFMSLSDAFSTPPAKTLGRIYRTNSFYREEEEGGIMYEVLSRLNHSCSPNVAMDYDGFTAVVSALQDVAPQEELLLCYVAALMDKPTSKRREALQAKYNFVCTCERCGAAPVELL